jgi:hypothetical protein
VLVMWHGLTTYQEEHILGVQCMGYGACLLQSHEGRRHIWLSNYGDPRSR